MKLFAATLATETNTFAVVPTGRVDFEIYGVYRGDASRKAPDAICGTQLAQLQRLAAADGHEVIESLAAFAQPAGPTRREVYEDFREQILEDLRAALPVDAVQLYLHGAMVAEGYDDCEGDLIQRVREIVGDKVHIGAELDLHCHFTERMRANADAIICFKEYPHTDILERGRELYRIAVDHVGGRIKPVTAVHDPRMVGLWPTTGEPMCSFVQRMKDLEGRDGVLSVSLGHGFPMGDVADSGARLWVIADGDPGKAAALARQLGQEFWDMRHACSPERGSVAQALQRASRSQRHPVVLADTGDNAGGGAMGDSTFVLRALLDAGIGNAALALYWDLGAVHLCQSAGVGATLDLRIGGKCGPMSGDPVDLRVTVRAIRENHSQAGLGAQHPLGTVVWVQAANGIDLLLSTIRSQVFVPELFTGMGIELTKKQLVVVKSNQHFHQGFAPIAADIVYLATPGSSSTDFVNMPYRMRDLNYWPRVDDPFAAEAAGN
jgi:microcystin degradation protein MlrC